MRRSRLAWAPGRARVALSMAISDRPFRIFLTIFSAWADARAAAPAAGRGRAGRTCVTTSASALRTPIPGRRPPSPSPVRSDARTATAPGPKAERSRRPARPAPALARFARSRVFSPLSAPARPAPGVARRSRTPVATVMGRAASRKSGRSRSASPKVSRTERVSGSPGKARRGSAADLRAISTSS